MTDFEKEQLKILQAEDGVSDIVIRGSVNTENAAIFGQKMQEYCHNRTALTADCSELEMLSTAACGELCRLTEKGFRLTMNHLNQDCYAALFTVGRTDLAGSHMQIPTYDIARLEKLGEGSNGIVYRLDDETALKVLKITPDFDDVLRERSITKLALAAGLDCPISMGFALVEGKLALKLEMTKAASLTKIYRKDPSMIDKTMEEYVAAIKEMHAVPEEKLERFPQHTFLKEAIEKSAGIEELLPARFTGRIVKMIEAIDEPDVLLHGDPQPGNIRYSETGISFIDMESLSVGPAVLDLAALRRTLFDVCHVTKAEENVFLQLPASVCEKIWKEFFRCYYAGESEEYIARKDFETAVIADVLMTHLQIKRAADNGLIQSFLKEIEALLDRGRC